MDKNAYFQLINKESGIYLKKFPPIDNGSTVSLDEVMYYLDEKKINDYNMINIKNFFNSAEGEIQIDSKPGLPEMEHVKITIDPLGNEAYGKFYPPSSDGRFATKEDIIAEMVSKGIKYGLVMDNLDAYLANRVYCTDILLAKATPAIDGKNAEIIYHFNTNVVSKPKMNEDGSVDFHQLGTIQHIKKGDLIATLVPADMGRAGIDIRGNVIKPKKVERKVLKNSKNITVSEDGLSMVSNVSGHVTLVDSMVFVSDTFEVPVNVDTSTGNIEYEGNVEVKGNVMNGFAIRASGNIIVNGVVEGATLIAGGDIIIKRGIQGMFRGHLEAKGNVVSKFIENSVVIAGGYIMTDAILHSKIRAKESITVSGKRGLISGGEIISGTMITAKTAGSHMGTATVLEIGTDPLIMEELKRLEGEIETLQSECDKMNQIITLLQNKTRKGEKLSVDNQKYLTVATQNCGLVGLKIIQNTNDYKSLILELENCKNGKIFVNSVTFSGVKILIAKATKNVNEEIYHAQYIRVGADIKVLGT